MRFTALVVELIRARPRLVVWLVIGLTIYFTYSRHHSHLAKMGRK